MTTSEHAIPRSVNLRRWFISIREWLGRVPPTRASPNYELLLFSSPRQLSTHAFVNHC